MTTPIPKPALQRLPAYYRVLKSAVEEGRQYVSSGELGKGADVAATQARKDLMHIAEKGRPGVGYEAKALAARLEDRLGLVKDKEAILAGAGNLGRALALYPGFKEYGLRIIVLFDNDPVKIGQRVGELEILPIQKLTDLAERMRIRIGIITTPVGAAQEVADAMVAGGVKAIWNFAPCNLDVPDGVLVKSENLVAELSVLSHYITQMKIDQP